MGKLYVVSVSLFASLGGFLTGYSIGSVNGLLNFSGFLGALGDCNFTSSTGNQSDSDVADTASHIDPSCLILVGTMVSILNLGGGIGNLLGGKPADIFGRKVTLVISAVTMLLGACIQSATFASWMYILGRFITGLGDGLYYMVGPLYISEISPENMRGALTSLVAASLGVGTVFATVSNIGLSRVNVGWRLSRLMLSVMTSFFVIGLFFLPRTPRWLMLKGREPEAREVLKKLTSSPESQKGQEAIELEIREIKESLDSHTNPSCLREFQLILKWKNLKRVLLAIQLHIFAAACGTVLFFYSELLFSSLGIVPFVTAIVIAIMTLCGAVFTSLFLDKFGRKPMMVGGGLLTSILIGSSATLVHGFNLEEENDLIVGYIVVALVCLFMLVYSATWYPIPWTVTSEIFSLEGRGMAVAISTAVNWFTIYAFTQAFPEILNSLKTYGTLYLIAFINLSAALFFLFFLPETKGTSLEEMDELFDKPWLERVGLFYYLRCGCMCPRNQTKNDQASPSSSIDDDRESQQNGSTSSNDLKHEHRQSEHLQDNDDEWETYWDDFEHELKETTV